ncbi:hypothetical protein HYN59_02440 [Flavobacterium album]|uniref:Uncharacterized protein n=1 Tax=Flavobacterium album TaxID=2175091 RepID=A0A2S1QUE7_9FLAO|nr:hypothetical protein HYN59_02440 [Flavobacterium album]
MYFISTEWKAKYGIYAKLFNNNLFVGKSELKNQLNVQYFLKYGVIFINSNNSQALYLYW